MSADKVGSWFAGEDLSSRSIDMRLPFFFSIFGPCMLTLHSILSVLSGLEVMEGKGNSMGLILDARGSPPLWV